MSRAGALFSYVDLEARVPAGHPLRAIREIANEALAGLSPILRDNAILRVRLEPLGVGGDGFPAGEMQDQALLHSLP